MLSIANAMQKINIGNANYSSDNRPPVVKRLEQDKFGIYAHVLLKSNIVKNVEDFIEYVD